jgi:hypothetical protein
MTLLFGVNAQVNFSWFPVRPGVQYNYKIDSLPAPLSNVIKIDSVSANAPFIYYLNKIVTSCDTCVNSNLANDPVDSTYVLNAQPQFLKQSFSKVSSFVFYFKGPRSMVILPYAALGLNWIFDTVQNITASVVARNVQNVLGTSDSVCIIKLSTNDTVILSKNYGVIQFPAKTNISHKYKLVGIEGLLNAGIKLKRFHDFFDFNAGDALQYSFSDTDYNIFPPMYMNGHERRDILAVNNYNDSVVCSIRRIYYDSVKYGINPASITAYTITENMSFIDSAAHMANLYPLQEIFVNPYFIYNNGIRAIHKIKTGLEYNSRLVKSFGENCPNLSLSPGNTGAAIETGIPHVFLNKNSSKVTGRKLVQGLGFTSELYNGNDRLYEKCLIGYIKGSDTSGTLYNGNPDYIPEHSVKKMYAVYPVPANDKVTITGNFSKGAHVKIVNSFGEEVLKENVINSHLFFDLGTSRLANGLYFIVISDRNLSETKKLIIQH